MSHFGRSQQPWHFRQSFRPGEAQPYPEEWYIDDEDTVPDSHPHDLRERRILLLLEGWQRRTRRGGMLARELACRWDERHPKVGVDPDVCYLEQTPPEGRYTRSLRTWETGHFPPKLAIEVVSKSRPQKDYVNAPERHELLGTEELWVFDADLLGHGPNRPSVKLQLFQRDLEGNLCRTYAGDGPMHSEVLDAWVFVTGDGFHLSIADDREGTKWWMTPEETERAAKEQALKVAEGERAAKEQAVAAKEQAVAAKEKALKVADDERLAKERALARIAELEAMLAAQK